MNIAHLHWLLDMAVEYAPPLHYFLPRVRGEHLNAPEIPGIRTEDYATLIRSAAEDGLVQLLSGEKALDLAEVDATLLEYSSGPRANRTEYIGIHLTSSGGAAWEQMSSPQWDRFFYFSFLLPDEQLRVSATLASQNWDTVVAYLGWFELHQSVDVNWETLRIEKQSNYPVTYWKRLDGVHEATLNGIYHLPERYAPTFASDWVHSLSNWRVRPWDRPDWPT